MKKGLKITLIVLAAVIVAALGLIAAFYFRVNDPGNVFAEATLAPTVEPTIEPTPAPTVTPDATPAPTESSAPTPTPTETPIPEEVLASMSDSDFMRDRVNILVLGIDRSVERLESNSFRSDTIILVSINFSKMTVDMISVPRDSYVLLYDKEGALINEFEPYGKVNSAFSYGGGVSKGGYEAEMATISKLFAGIPVSYYVGFDMNAVKLIVDAMGGVDYEVDVEVSMNGRFLHPGMQHLDGQGVLDYCRQRKGSSDIARTDRQQRMLMAIFDQMKSTGQIANIPKIYKAVSDSIDTSLSFEQICSLALMATKMDFADLSRYTVKGKGADIYGRSCYLVYNEKLIDIAKDVFGVAIEPDPMMDADAMLATIAANRQAIAAELSAASASYERAKYLMTNYKSVISSSTYKELSDARKELSTGIRIENRDYLLYYTQLVDSLVARACSEAGISMPGISMPGVSVQDTTVPDTTAPDVIAPDATPFDDTLDGADGFSDPAI